MNIGKMKEINQLHIFDSQMQKAIESINMCRNLNAASFPTCLSITGPSGVGKTTMLRYFEKQILDSESNVLMFSLPAPVSVSTIVSAMLEKIGDPLFLKGTVAQRVSRVMNHIKDSGVQMLIIDDFQRIVDPRNQRPNLEVLTWLRNIIDQMMISLVIVGTQESLLAVNYDERFGRRLPFHFSMESYRMADFDEILPLVEEKFKMSGLADLAVPLYHASGGMLGALMQLIKLAAWFALENGQHQITADDFSEAFARLNTHSVQSNPFIEMQQFIDKVTTRE